MASQTPISVQHFVDSVLETSKSSAAKQTWHDAVVSGIIGEYGSISTIFKKHLLHENEFRLTPYSIQKLGEEIGDLLWYLVALSIFHKFDFGSDVLFEGLSKLPPQFEVEGVEDTHLRLKDLDNPTKQTFIKELYENKNQISIDFDTYQRVAALTQLTSDTVQMTKVCLAEISRYISRLTRNTLSIDTQSKIYKFGKIDTLSCIQDVMWNISNVAQIQGLSLSQIATKNKCKTKELYPNPQTHSNLRTHNKTFLPEEHFPDKFDIQVIDIGNEQSRMYFNGQPLGDDINDNSRILDGYRFHDVLHLAFVAHLGWSPVIRSMMKRKRKSVREIDLTEDGARSRLAEELIVLLMHNEAVRLQLARSHPGALSTLFPKDEHFSSEFGSTLRHLVRDIEVADIKHWEWEKAAHSGFAAYQELTEHREGTLTIDRTNRTLIFNPHLALDLHGVTVRQSVDIRNNMKGASSEALLAATHSAACPSLEFESVKSEIEIHRSRNGEYIAQLRGQARNNARKDKIISVKLCQSECDNTIFTIATALADPYFFFQRQINPA